MKNHIYLTYEEDRMGGESVDDSDPWSNREPEYITFNVIGLYAENPGGWPESIPVDFVVLTGMPVYVIIVRYKTGDTFGETSGAWHVVGAYDNMEEAKKILESIENDSFDGYKPWDGYFEVFQSARIHPMTLY